MVRMLATNVAKAARVDQARTCRSGAIGAKLKDELLRRFERI